jgi:hypothetical protein
MNQAASFKKRPFVVFFDVIFIPLLVVLLNQCGASLLNVCAGFNGLEIKRVANDVVMLFEKCDLLRKNRRMLLNTSRDELGKTVGEHQQSNLIWFFSIMHSVKFRNFARMYQRKSKGNTQPFFEIDSSRLLSSRKSLLQRSWTFILFAFPFIDIFLFRYSFNLFPGPLGYGPFLCMYLLLPVFVVRYKFPVKVTIALVLVGLIGSSGAVSGIVEQVEFVKVFGSLILPYLYYWYLWQFLGEDVVNGFRLYLKGAVIVSVIGLLVFIDSLISFGFYEFFNSILHITKVPAAFGIRISGTLGEPTYFANTIAPAGFFALLRLFFGESSVALRLKEQGLWLSRYHALVIVVTLVLTYSTIAFTGFLISVGLHLLIKRQVRTLLIAPIILVALFSVAQSIPEINDRIEGLQNASQVAEQDVHGSSAILYNHAVITWENFRRNPLFGTGLGSHAVATEKYTILERTKSSAYSEQNAPDASSMFLRIASELGLFGVLLTFYFLAKNYFVVNPGDDELLILKMISAACLVTILLQLMRQGNFILNGFPFFVYCYYFAWKQFRELSLGKQVAVEK